MEEVSTKNRILYAALELFSKKGYDGVGIDEIGAAVGIKGPSIYRHFKGKQDIMDSLHDTIDKYYSAKVSEKRTIPKSKEEFLQMTFDYLYFTLHDERICMARKLLVLEQFRHPKYAKSLSSHAIVFPKNTFKYIFLGMMREGLMKMEDVEYLSLEFIAPVSLLIQCLDREDNPEYYHQIEQHVQQFVEKHFI